MSSTTTSNSTTVKLASVEHWSRWIETLKTTAEGQGIWYKVDPELPAEASDLLVEPEMPGNTVLEQYITDRTTENHTPTMLEAIQFYNVVHKEACRKFKAQEAKELALHKWIASTVNPSLHSSTLETIRAETERRQVTLREITKKLKDSFSPGLMIIKAETSTMYKDILDEARWANTSPDKWIEKWNTTYQKAVRHDINEIKGANAIHDFIQAVGAKFEPTWAEAKKVKLVEYNNDIPAEFTLKSVSDEFMRYRKATRVYDKDTPKGVHATLGTRSDTSTKQDNGSKSKGADCPCGFVYQYKPQQCRTLLYAITGELVNKKKTPQKELCAKIKQRYDSPKWETLRKLIAQEGWAASNTEQTMPKEQFPGKVSAAILDPVMIEGNAPQTVFTATENHSHMLANSTLFDNCGAMHVVNNEALLEPGSFKLTFGDCLEAGTTSFPIYGRGTRIIKNILHGNKGPCTEDLILNDVAVLAFGDDIHMKSAYDCDVIENDCDVIEDKVLGAGSFVPVEYVLDDSGVTPLRAESLVSRH
ncbi:hypothetical protein E4U46_002360 [Claviceps purpurea]|nr:hypothetical protein E4U46_002360 [Claviceps purpurea]